jgi:hypothetical protein
MLILEAKFVSRTPEIYETWSIHATRSCWQKGASVSCSSFYNYFERKEAKNLKRDGFDLVKL